MRFSERYGFSPARAAFQTNSIDEPLRNGLWNAVDQYIIYTITDEYYNDQSRIHNFLYVLWRDFYKFRMDEMYDELRVYCDLIRSRLLEGSWHGTYDFIEYALQTFPFSEERPSKDFREQCNLYLKREMSAYRIIGLQVVCLTSDEEIETVEKATKLTGKNAPVATHIITALKHLSDRKTPDYRNAIKEAISAVESMCCIVADDPKATLRAALSQLEAKGVNLHSQLKTAFHNLYNYTSDAEGIRHALLDEPRLDFEDAKFMLVSCSAFVNLLQARSGA